MMQMLTAATEANTTMACMTSTDPAVLHYEAQFLYNDPSQRRAGNGGPPKRSQSASVLRAVAWQQRRTALAAQLGSWESRLHLTDNHLPGSALTPGTVSDGLVDGSGFVGDSYAAARTQQQQRMADLHAKKTSHALTGTQMQAETFDNVYSEAHSTKDTASALSNGAGHFGFLVPTVDQRSRYTRPKDTEYGKGHTIATAKGPRELLPSRTVMGISEFGCEQPSAGRIFDF